MTAYRAYTTQPAAPAYTRIDLLLALYDGALDRLDKAAAAVGAGDPATAAGHASRVQLMVSELAGGVKPEVNPELAANYLRLYEFVADRLRTPTAASIADARKVLLTLRDGFEAVRAEANDLERGGHLASADRLMMLSETA